MTRTQCPYCGGQSGLVTKEIVRRDRYTRWDGTDINVGDEIVIDEDDDSIPRCQDCKKRIYHDS